MSLSGGESQFLKLLIHASAEGEIYLFDEPGQYLDREKKQLASDLMKTILAKGKKVIVVEHDQQWLPPGSVATHLIQTDGILKRGETWNI